MESVSGEYLTETRDKMLLIHKNKVIDLYKEGYGLGQLCRMLCLDISSIVYILRKSKMKKKSLYVIYQEQTNRPDSERKELLTEDDKFYLDKFFPSADTSNFSNSYYFFWKEKFKKENKQKQTCEHHIRTITCSTCKKILKDASNIRLDEIKITKI